MGEKFEEETKDKFRITQAMTRQYEAMQEELVDKAIAEFPALACFPVASLSTTNRPT